MSNKRVKNMYSEDYDDDFADEDEFDDGGEEMSEEDKQQMERATKKVRDVLGSDVMVSDKDIQDSLWYYFYDVEKTVNYILGMPSTILSQIQDADFSGQITAAETKAAKQTTKKATKGEQDLSHNPFTGSGSGTLRVQQQHRLWHRQSGLSPAKTHVLIPVLHCSRRHSSELPFCPPT